MPEEHIFALGRSLLLPAMIDYVGRTVLSAPYALFYLCYFPEEEKIMPKEPVCPKCDKMNAIALKENEVRSGTIKIPIQIIYCSNCGYIHTIINTLESASVKASIDRLRTDLTNALNSLQR